MRNAAVSLLALFLCTSAFAAGHEITTPVLGPSPLGASDPHVATNGETFAAIWFNAGTIYGTLADSAGRRITAAAVRVMPISQSSAGTAAITALGRDYILFWGDSLAFYLTDLGSDLKARQTVRLKDIPSLTGVSAASNGSQIVIAGFTGNIFPPAQEVVYVLNRDGSLARAPVNLKVIGRVHASWSGKEFLIAIATTTGVVLQRLGSDSATQQISSATGRFSDPLPSFAAAASSGDSTMVVWTESADAVPPLQTFWSAVVDDDGRVTRQQIYSLSTPAVRPANIVWNGEAFVATFGYLVFRLERNGANLGPPTDAGHSISEIAGIGDVVYGAGAQTFPTPAMVTVLRTLSTIHDVHSDFLSITPAAQRDPAIASDGIDFMAVFREETGTTRSLKAAPLRRATIAAADQPPFLADTISLAASAIAHGDSVYVVTWADGNGVFAQRLSNQGIVIDTQPIKITADRYSSRPDIAWNGKSFLVTWTGDGGIMAALVGEDGKVSPSQVVASGSIEPRVAWNGKVFLLVYGIPQVCPFECPVMRYATYVVRISPNGAPIDTTPIVIDAAQPPQYWPAASRATVASNGSDFLVALDRTSGAAVIKVTAGATSITIGEPRSVFAWFTFVDNDIRWNGGDYVLASHYSIGTKHWLALTHLTASSEVRSRIVAVMNSGPVSSPALATNSLSDDAVITVEPLGDPAVPRALVYFDSDFSMSPSPPAAPTNVTATGTSSNFTMTWTLGQDAEAVVIETRVGPYSIFAVVPPEVHSQTFSNPSITSVTLRSLNAGGLSEAVGALLQTPPRRRATRGR